MAKVAPGTVSLLVKEWCMTLMIILRHKKICRILLYTIYASNGLELMKCYIEAFRKIFDQLDKVVTNPKYYERVRAKLE